MAKNKKTKNSVGGDVMVLVGKGSYATSKGVIRKGDAITKAEYEALPEERKVLFTDAKSAKKLVKKAVEPEPEDEGREVDGGGDEPSVDE